MKKFLKFFSLFLFALAILSSCNNDDDEVDPFPSEMVKGCYIVNYGNYGAGGASISKYDYDADVVSNQYYKTQNTNEILSNIQHGSIYKDQVFLMANEPDMVIELDPLFKQTMNGISEKIAKPRYSVADGKFLYVSCWGNNPDWSVMADTYLAKIDLNTNEVVDSIPLPGGPEGLAIAKGKLYAALNFKDSVAVFDLNDMSVSYIETPAVTSYFLKDKSNNLYVSLLSTWSDPSDNTGLGYINTSNDELETTFNMPGVSTEYASIMEANNEFSKIYIITAGYDANWNLVGAVSEFDVASKTFASENLISDLSGPKGLTVNPYNDDIYVFAAETVTGAGLMKIYNSNGEFIKEETVGASPTMAIFIE